MDEAILDKADASWKRLLYSHKGPGLSPEYRIAASMEIP